MTYFNRNTTENSIKSSIRRRIGDVAFSSKTEIVNALAYACTFKSPRRFADMDMNERTWQDLAATITVLELDTVNESLTRFTHGNRLFYILGCLTRVYSRRKSTSSTTSNFRERRYTNAELDRVVIRPEDLADIEW